MRSFWLLYWIYDTDDDQKIASFHFPHTRKDLLEKWIKFVNRWNWELSTNSSFSEKHFQEQYINCRKRCTLKWKLNPVSTIHSKIARTRPSSLPNISIYITHFVKVIWKWWTIANSRQQYTSNPLANAITNHDDKIEFYLKLADWLESWTCSNFYLSKQTSKTLVLTLRSQAMMIKYILSEGYLFLLTQRLESNPIESRIQSV